MRINASDMLSRVAEEASESCFVEEYKTPDTKERRRENGLGIRLAQFCDWDGLKIMRIFRDALEDANFHTEAGIVEDWLQKEGQAD